MLNKLLSRYKTELLYGAALAFLLLLLKWLQWKLLIIDHAMELYAGLIAVIFTVIGIWLALKLARPSAKMVILEKEVVIEKEVLVEKQVIIEKIVLSPVHTDTSAVLINDTSKASGMNSHTPAVENCSTTAEAILKRLGMSKRELEVLELMARGLSNQEIADQLFVSLNTVKTHSSNIFLKLDVKRRTQAIDLAKKLQIIP